MTESTEPAPADLPPGAPATPAAAPPNLAGASVPAPAPVSAPPLTAAGQTIAAGYRFTGPTLNLGALMEGGVPHPDAPITLPLGMLNRHGLIAGATGTGKTKTLQLIAEQIALAGVPVFAADIKGDLTGLALPGQASDKLLARTSALGQQWTPTALPVEFYRLGDQGLGVPLRCTLTAFGPTLLAKILGLSDVGASCLELVFYYAAQNNVPLIRLDDLRALLTWLNSDAGKTALEGLGGISKATTGVILRELIGLSAQGADAFFGQPAFASADLLRTVADGRGVISLLELANLQDRPQIFATFLMWLLRDLFATLPEVGDLDRPKLVFFFDEAHLLFDGASKALLDTVAQTVRLIRSKGVGVFFITQLPTDVPDVVLAQLGSRVQHQLRAHTPNDQEALAKTVKTYPRSPYDLAATLQALGIGEAIVTVMDPDGAPTPVAWTRMRAPQSLMGAAPAEALQPAIQASAMMAKYGTPVEAPSAADALAASSVTPVAAPPVAAAPTVAGPGPDDAAERRQRDAEQAAQRKAEEQQRVAEEKQRAQAEKERLQAERERAKEEKAKAAARQKTTTAVTRVLTNAASQFARSAISSLFRKR